MDYDLLCRFLTKTGITYCHTVLSRFRMHNNSKTYPNFFNVIAEYILVYKRYSHLLDNSELSDANFADVIAKMCLYQFRKLNIKTTLKLLKPLFQTMPNKAIHALLKEFNRLILGGRYTGRF
jgi:hypothetical protein